MLKQRSVTKAFIFSTGEIHREIASRDYHQEVENKQNSLVASREAIWKGFLGGSEDKESTCSVGDQGSILVSGTSPGEGNGNPLQYPCLEDSMAGGAWQATVHGIAKSQTQLSYFTFTFQNSSLLCLIIFSI